MAFELDDLLESDNVDAAIRRNRALGILPPHPCELAGYVFVCVACKVYKRDPSRPRTICANCQNVLDGGVGPQVSVDAVAAMKGKSE